jgi:D-3-phosphoglycerate dehydrogenase
MIECLKDGTLFQAGLDVFDAEPIKPESVELFDLDNVIMTPHMAATTEQSVLNCCTSVANDIVAVCNGNAPACPAFKPKF